MDTPLIDLEEVIRSKNPKLLKKLPSFVLKYMKRIVHQKELNNFIADSKNDHNHEYVKSILNLIDVSVTSKGLHHIPTEGPSIIVCNHPLGGVDGIAVMHEVAKVRNDLKALVNDLLLSLKNMNELMVPIDKHAKNVISNLKQIDKCYGSDECIIIFPAGLVSRFHSGKVHDLKWEKSFVNKAIKYKTNVIPVYIDAKNSRFFYTLAYFRKMLGIKANLEMFYLVNESFKQKGKTIELTFGKPIPYTSFTKERKNCEWAQKVKRTVYSLKNK